MSNVLVVAAHPDDEVLGCGATIARHAACGDHVAVLLLADGVGARGDSSQLNPSEVESRRDCARAAAAVLGVESLQIMGLPDNRLDSKPLLDIVRIVEDAALQYEPELVYTHFAHDLNIDHRVAHYATLTAFRPPAFPNLRRISCFEVLSSTEWMAPQSGAPFSPNLFIDVAEFLPRKLEALDCYSDEMRDFPHPRSIEAVKSLAALRGSTANLHAAEAFVVAREIQRSSKS